MEASRCGFIYPKECSRKVVTTHPFIGTSESLCFAIFRISVVSMAQHRPVAEAMGRRSEVADAPGSMDGKVQRGKEEVRRCQMRSPR